MGHCFMTYGKVITGASGATLAATGVSLGYTWALAAALIVIGLSIIAIRVFFKRGM